MGLEVRSEAFERGPGGGLDLSDDELNNAAGGTSILDGWDMIEAQNL